MSGRIAIFLIYEYQKNAEYLINSLLLTSKFLDIISNNFVRI